MSFVHDYIWRFRSNIIYSSIIVSSGRTPYPLNGERRMYVEHTYLKEGIRARIQLSF